MSTLPKLVIPAVATLGVLYPSSFLIGMWQSAEKGEIDAPGTRIAGGELTNGWRYDVYERHFPHTYRLDMSAEGQEGGMCVMEVRQGPQPISVSPGADTLVHVTLAEPLPGHSSSRVTIDLEEALVKRCAAEVTADGELHTGGKMRPAAAFAAVPQYTLTPLADDMYPNQSQDASAGM